MTAAEWLAQVKARNTPTEIAPWTPSRDIVTFQPREVGFVMASAWLRASADALVLVAAIEAVLAECRDMADAAGHRDRIRDAITAALDPS